MSDRVSGFADVAILMYVCVYVFSVLTPCRSVRFYSFAAVFTIMYNTCVPELDAFFACIQNLSTTASIPGQIHTHTPITPPPPTHTLTLTLTRNKRVRMHTEKYFTKIVLFLFNTVNVNIYIYIYI